MTPTGFETTISANELPQTYDSDRAATGTEYICFLKVIIHFFVGHMLFTGFRCIFSIELEILLNFVAERQRC